MSTDEIAADTVLAEALKAPGFKSVLVIGRKLDGTLYVASSAGWLGEIFLLMERAKHQLITTTELEAEEWP